MPEILASSQPQARSSAGGSGFKASMQRIAAWIKAHPIPSLIILVVLVVIGYFLYKRAGSGASSSGSDLTVTAPGDGGISGTLAGPGGGDQVGTTGGGGGGQINTEPPAVLPPSGGGGGGGGYVPPAGGGGAPVDYSSFLLPAGDLAAAGVPSGEASGGAALVGAQRGIGAGLASVHNGLADSLQQQAASRGASQVGAGMRGVPNLGNIRQPATSEPLGSRTPQTSDYTPPPTNKKKGGGKSGVQTPAQLAGKGKNFTGFIGGVQYINGYPVNLTSGQSYLTTASGGEVQQVTQTSSGRRRRS